MENHNFKSSVNGQIFIKLPDGIPAVFLDMTNGHFRNLEVPTIHKAYFFRPKGICPQRWLYMICYIYVISI